ncbi:MAG TPA: DUF1569 domain-containing protein [Acidobacteriaceae bacterium]|nr:DUF1569 domain-containing protein [Acidobacteriaceae bacterium]
MHAVLEDIASRFSRELAGLDEGTAQRHPRDLNYIWSIQQVTEHLVLSYRLTAQVLEDRLRKGHSPRKRRSTLLQRVLRLMVLSFGYLPRGVPACPGTEPVSGLFPEMDGECLARQLQTELRAMDELLDRCRQQFGMEPVADHPVFGTMRVDQWRRYHVLHGLHHLEQLRRVREQTAPQAVASRAFKGILTKELQIPAHRPLA